MLPVVYRAAFERSRHPMLIVDGAGVIREINAAAASLVGRERVDLVGRDRRTAFEPPEARALVDAQQAALRGGSGWVGAYAIDAEGARGLVDVCAEPDLVLDRHLVLFARRDRAEPPPDHEAVGPTLLPVPPGGPVRLTAREREIVALLADGATSPPVAARLFLSEHTVRTHVRNAMDRSGARTRAHLVVVALRAGLLDAERDPAV